MKKKAKALAMGILVVLTACSQTPNPQKGHRRLAKSDLKKLRLEMKDSEIAIYNGTEWSLASVDIEVTANPTDSASSETRRFRLFPLRSSIGDQPTINPFSARAVDSSDISAFLKERKGVSHDFVEAD